MKTKAKHGERRTLCAICDNTNQTTKLCDTCRADPANEGWSEEWEGIEFTDDIEEVQTSGPVRTLADLVTDDPPPRPASDLERQILELYVAVGKATRDTSGRFRKPRIGIRQIAVRVGCRHSFVQKVIAHFEEGTVSMS